MRIIESDQKDIIRKRGPIKEGEGIHAWHAFICAGQNGLVTCICTGHWARDMYLCWFWLSNINRTGWCEIGALMNGT